MPMRNRLIGAAAALGLAACLGAGGAATASAATPACGKFCAQLLNRLAGPGLEPDVVGQRAQVGQPIVLSPASDSNAGQDFKFSVLGKAADFYAAGLVPAAIGQHFPDLEGYEFQYAPSGVQTALCIGVGSTPGNGTPVVLEPCGVNASTLWFLDSAQPLGGSYAPLINGAGTRFPNPYVLSFRQNYFLFWPGPRKLETAALQHPRFSRGVEPRELWNADLSQVHS